MGYIRRTVCNATRMDRSHTATQLILEAAQPAIACRGPQAILALGQLLAERAQ